MPVNATSTYSIDNAQDYPVVVNNWCKRVTVQEDFDSTHPPTQDMIMKMPPTGGATRVSRGTAAIYTPVGRLMFQPGETVGSIRTAAGAITVQQVESNQV